MSSNARLACAAALALSLCALASAGDARTYHRPASLPRPVLSHHVAFMGYLHDGRVVTVYADGRASIAPPRTARTTASTTRDRRAALKQLQDARARRAATGQRWLSTAHYGSLEGDVPQAVRRQILLDLDRNPARYAPGRVIVVFKPGVTIAQDSAALSPAAALNLRRGLAAKRRDLTPHAFTNDARTNLALMQLGVDRADRLFANVDRATLASMRGRAEGRIRHPLVAFDNAFVLSAGASSVENAVRTLRASPNVAYAAPDLAVSPMIAERRPLPDEAVREIAGYHRSPRTFGRATRSTAQPMVPRNTAVSFNLQAMLNAPGVDAVAAFDEIGERFGQLPGAGEIITNVGIGDVFDAAAAADANDPCNQTVTGGGATAHRIGGQRYLDMPSMPLIPVWVADANGNLSNTDSVCNVDPFLGEVGLDFSVMAPLPDDAQRPGEIAPLASDLLGIAPGASYRWVAPGTTQGLILSSNTLGALLGAARQQPAPNVITMSIGYGADGYGFPGRYFEDDQLSQSVVAGIVASNVVVCIAANDGTRMLTTAAVGPSGGSAPTNAGTTGTTTISDVFLTTVPSVVPDSGAIAVGSTTLDDVFSANPQDPAFASLANVKAFAETRYNGTLGFSSGFGSRVNLSAPGDNINALFRNGRAYDAIALENTGGTSASAPEVAAAAAVALQVARLTGHPFTSATQVRDALVATGTPVATPPQSDVPLNVGPQVSVRRVVEQLLANAGKPVQPGIARVAIHGRRSSAFIASFNERFVNDATYTTALDPSYIKLDGPFTRPTQVHSVSWPGSDTGADLNSYITIAPDWEGIPANATYRLAVAGDAKRVIATTPYARMLPAQLFAAAGVPLTPGASRTLSLTYSASVGLHAIAESTFQLTFGPPAPSSRLVLAPKVPAVVSGATIPVTYDLRAYPSSQLSAPVLNVSLPGIGSLFFQGLGIYPYYSMPLTATNGTVNVPVSALAGAGTYTLWIDLQPGTTAFQSDISDLAFTRVDAGTARPPAPLLSLARGAPTAHTLDIPYKGTFTVSYDVSNVPRATGAIVEISAPPPSPFFYTVGFGIGLNTFRNPNGSALDEDGVITGSVYHVQANGTNGTLTIDPAVAKIPATASANVRVIPTAGGAPVGEASDSDYITYEGINTAFGLPLGTVFMDPNGSDGLLSEYGGVGNRDLNTTIYAAEPFDLGAGSVGGVDLAFTSGLTSIFPIVQNDVGLASSGQDYGSLNDYRAAPLSAGFSSFAFPAGTFPPNTFVANVALNSTPARSAYVGIDTSTGDAIVARGDVTTGAGFNAGIDIMPLLAPNVDYVAFASFSYDPETDRAYMLMNDSSQTCDVQSPNLITIDFTTGTASSRTLPIRAGTPNLFGTYQMAIDPATHVAAIATSCVLPTSPEQGTFSAELTLLDLTTGTTSRAFHHEIGIDQLFHGSIFLPGGDSAVIGVDLANHLILQRSMFCPELIGRFDLNARPCLNVYDERGHLVNTVPGLFGDGIPDSSFNGVNGAKRTGVAQGQPQYGISIESFSVQPYSY
ncbi:MAG: peptidase and in kexin sedolisin [Candidatus Eremiobacteraeota bacterium]|nr:peptidase and in kexin sedolisin [Candidatus Eremiobacteraeota bacterium]